MQVESACASAVSEHSTPSRCDRIDEAQNPGAARSSKKQADSSSRFFQKNVGMTAAAFPTVLRKQRPKRRGVSEVVQRSSSNVRKQKSKSGLTKASEESLGEAKASEESHGKPTDGQIKFSLYCRRAGARASCYVFRNRCTTLSNNTRSKFEPKPSSIAKVMDVIARTVDELHSERVKPV